APRHPRPPPRRRRRLPRRPRPPPGRRLDRPRRRPGLGLPPHPGSPLERLPLLRPPPRQSRRNPPLLNLRPGPGHLPSRRLRRRRRHRRRPRRGRPRRPTARPRLPPRRDGRRRRVSGHGRHRDPRPHPRHCPRAWPAIRAANRAGWPRARPHLPLVSPGCSCLARLPLADRSRLPRRPPPPRPRLVLALRAPRRVGRQTQIPHCPPGLDL
ncbi:MAG: Acetyltransferase, GNAT family, partial [uncultured Thermomicrobiales bacterium]